MQRERQQSDGFPMAVVVEGGLALVAALLAWLFGVRLRDQFPTQGQPLAIATARGIVAAMPMLALFWILIRSRRPSLQHLRHQVEWLVNEMFPSRNAAQFGMIALLAGVGEELLFRGVIQTKLSDWTSPVAGLVAASLLFGAAHALSRLYFLLATVIGLYLGWFAQHYGELVTPIVAHSVYDFLALLYLGKQTKGRVGSSGKNPSDDTNHRKPNES